MKLGFVSAILPDLSLEEVAAFAAETGYSCVELMCWPLGGAERRYAGVTHVDVDGFNAAKAEKVNATMAGAGVEISGLGYYPNPLTPVAEEAKVYVEHIKKVIVAAEMLGVGVVNTFIGRDWTKSVDDNWPRFKQTWVPLVRFAEDHGVKIGIENCPMLFTADEWPGGKNLAHSPAVWTRMFEDIPSKNFGLNFDPSHLVWQFIDCDRAIRDFGSRIVHAHAKDAKI
ncbi:MAG: sugar phosphate isomerase/epimerase family protein, partial [Thermoguttaceae bacterium]